MDKYIKIFGVESIKKTISRLESALKSGSKTSLYKKEDGSVSWKTTVLSDKDRLKTKALLLELYRSLHSVNK